MLSTSFFPLFIFFEHMGKKSKGISFEKGNWPKDLVEEARAPFYQISTHVKNVVALFDDVEIKISWCSSSILIFLK